MVAIVFILLLVFIVIGMPIGFSLLTAGSIGILYTAGFDSLISILSKTAFSSVNNFTYSAIPLFIVMAHFISKSKIANDFFDSILKWIGHTPGGAGIATVFGSAGFGALSGSSIAATSVMSQIAVPEMIRSGYSQSFSSGLVASSTGTLAVMIPPSIPLILYGIQTENSIGKLLIAGIFPGILLAILLSVTVFIVGIKQNSRTEKYSWKERFNSLKTIWPVVLLILIVMSVIYMGIGTATEAAAFGALGALVIGFGMKRLNFNKTLEALIIATKQTAMIFTIIIGAHVFAYFVALTRLGNKMIEVVENSGFSNWTILLFIILLYLVIGMFIDLIGSMLLTLPLIYPLIVELGYDPIWFGIIVVLLLEIGLVTPPVGMNLFITSQNSGVPVGKVIVGSMPFVGVLFLTVLILILFPQIILYLPYNM